MLNKVLLTAFFAFSSLICRAQHQSTNLLADASLNYVPTEVAATESSAFYARIPVVNNLIGFAKKHLSIRYRSGGTSPSGFDCSGFTRFCFSRFGINLPHSSAAQGTVGQKVERELARPGDLIFFNGHSAGGNRVGHVGMITEVVGHQIKFIHSAWSGGIRFDYLHADYYRNRFVGIRRVTRLMAEK